MSIIPGTLDSQRDSSSHGALTGQSRHRLPPSSRPTFSHASLMEQEDNLGERSRKFEALPLFIADSLDLTSLSKLFPDEHHLCIARIGGNRETEFPAHLQHRLVLPQNIANEFSDTALPGDVYKTLH